MSVQVPLAEKSTQIAMACRCGRKKILALGLYATCYSLKRHDEEYFEGLREAVLERDGYELHPRPHARHSQSAGLRRVARPRRGGKGAHSLAPPLS